MKGRLTLFTSPALLAKRWEWVDGEARKTTAAQMTSGSYKVLSFDSVSALVDILRDVSTKQALCASIPLDGSEAGAITTRAAAADRPGALTRTKDCFALPSGPGIGFIDCDEAGISRDQLFAMLFEAAPALRDAAMLWRPSGSSHIFHGDQDLTGLRGQHVVVPVADASDWPRALKVIAARLWLAGHGRVKVSSAGALLERCPVDLAVGEAARLLFVGGSHCEPPLEQRRGDVVVKPGEWLDSRGSIADLSSEEAGRLEGLIAQAKAAALPEAQRLRELHRASTISRRMPELMRAGCSASEAEARIGAACDAALAGVLLGDFELSVVGQDGLCTVVTVGQVLADRDRWHGATCLDPLNPEHRGGSPDAILYLHEASPVLYSLDDGGQIYRLRVQRVKVTAAPGGRDDVVQQLAAVVSELDSVFFADGFPVVLVNDRLVTLTRAHLLNLLGTAVAFFRQTGRGVVPADIPPDLADLVLSHLATY